MAGGWLRDLLERLDRWQTPDGLDVEPRRIDHACIRWTGKLSLSATKMARGREFCAALERRRTKP